MSKSLLPSPATNTCLQTPLLREPLSATAAAELAITLKALADPVRLQLFSTVASHAGGEACVCDISADVEVSQPTVSHHLRVLRDAGLLTAQRRGSWVYYAVAPDALGSMAVLLGAVDAAAGVPA